MSGNNENSFISNVKAFFGVGSLALGLATVLGLPWFWLNTCGYWYFQAKPVVDAELVVEEKTLALLAGSATSLHVIAISVSVFLMAYMFFKIYELFVANNKDL